MEKTGKTDQFSQDRNRNIWKKHLLETPDPIISFSLVPCNIMPSAVSDIWGVAGIIWIWHCPQVAWPLTHLELAWLSNQIPTSRCAVKIAYAPCSLLPPCCMLPHNKPARRHIATCFGRAYLACACATLTLLSGIVEGERTEVAERSEEKKARIGLGIVKEWRWDLVKLASWEGGLAQTTFSKSLNRTHTWLLRIPACIIRNLFAAVEWGTNKVCLKSPGKDPKASSAHSPGRSVPGLMRQTLRNRITIKDAAKVLLLK